VQAELTNGKTVDQKAVSWTVAVIAGLALFTSAITSGLGHSNTAAHVAANTLALFGYFQAQSLVGMTAVPLPPIVASWTQNFQWSMGIIRVGFIQDIATWYQRSTGGTPSTVLSELSTESVEVQKRSVHVAERLLARGAMKLHQLLPRAAATTDATTKTIILRGIERVGFRSKIELTNIFLTGYIFLLIFVVFVVCGVIIFKFICEGLVKMGKMKGDKFQDFRNGWTTVLKGILFRLVLIGFPQMVVLCFWEFTKRDSVAEVVLAVFTVFTMIGILAWASSKVIRLARRSVSMHKNPAYILYSDPVSLNKWGFLYVQFKATAYYFIVPVLGYLLLKGMFVALAQGNGTLQAIAFLIIEAVFFIIVCVLTPYMDKKTNAFNILICLFNFLNAIFLLFFTGIFSLPGLVNGVMGILFSSPFLSLRLSPSFPRTPTPDTSPCATTVVPSSSLRLNSTPSSTHWVLPLVAKARVAGRVLASKTTRTVGLVVPPPSLALVATAPPWLVDTARFLALLTTPASRASLQMVVCQGTTLPHILMRRPVSHHRICVAPTARAQHARHKSNKQAERVRGNVEPAMNKGSSTFDYCGS
jgi:hypothetical protein